MTPALSRTAAQEQPPQRCCSHICALLDSPIPSPPSQDFTQSQPEYSETQLEEHIRNESAHLPTQKYLLQMDTYGAAAIAPLFCAPPPRERDLAQDDPADTQSCVSYGDTSDAESAGDPLDSCFPPSSLETTFKERQESFLRELRECVAKEYDDLRLQLDEAQEEQRRLKVQVADEVRRNAQLLRRLQRASRVNSCKHRK
ncbi:hypothetical protein EV714DRAFT_276517 [Schizophyllum commune]